MAGRKFGDDIEKLGSRFAGDDSPFIVKEGKLWEFRPRLAIDFLRESGRTSNEREIVLAGLTAWMIAPTGVINTKQQAKSKVGAGPFIHRAMVITAAELLDDTLHGAREDQLESADMSSDRLLMNPLFEDFPFDMFFALGGMEAVLEVGSRPDFQGLLDSQFAPTTHVVMLVKTLIDAFHDPEKRSWRVEQAAKALADELAKPYRAQQGTIPRGIGSSTLKNHWRALREAAPLVYAAQVVDDGLFVQQIFRDPSLEVVRDYGYSSDWIASWLKQAGEIATILQNMGLLRVWPPEDSVFYGRKETLL